MGSSGQEKTRRRRPRLRRVAAVAALAFGGIALLVAAALVWTTTRLQRSVVVVVRDTQSQAVASEVELALLTYHRLANLQMAAPNEEVASARRETARRLRQRLHEAGAFVGSAEERSRLDSIERSLQRYFRHRQQLDAQDLGLEEVTRRIRPALNAALADLRALSELNAEQVQRADQDALRLNRMANVTGLAGAGILLLGLTVVFAGARRYLVEPVLELHETLEQLEAGEAEARTTPRGPREIADLATALNDMADALARQREQQLIFLAGVAHDLRNPLSTVKVGLQALEDEPAEEERRRARRVLDRQVDRLARMIDDLLDATRIESGNLELHREDLDFRDVVRETVELYEHTSPAHEVVSKLPDSPVTVSGDPDRLAQVLSNLLSNAIKYSPDGGEVTVALERDEGEAILSVTDEGIGIAPDELSGLFRPFRRRKPEVAPGAGLGLSVTRRIVDAHDGTIEVESEPDEGSTFRVRLPLAEESRPEAPAPAGA